jgi:hypothetical protein
VAEKPTGAAAGGVVVEVEVDGGLVGVVVVSAGSGGRVADVGGPDVDGAVALTALRAGGRGPAPQLHNAVPPANKTPARAQ